MPPTPFENHEARHYKLYLGSSFCTVLFASDLERGEQTCQHLIAVAKIIKQNMFVCAASFLLLKQIL